MSEKLPPDAVKLLVSCGVDMAAETKKIRVKLVRSTIGRKPEQKKTAKALGLGKMNSVVEKEATPSILGMVQTISHLVEVEEIS